MTSQYQVLATVTFYMVAAIVMVTVNKWVLVNTDTPITFITLQLALAGVLLEAIRRLGIVQMSRFQVSTAKQLSPVILANTASIVLSNLCLQYVDSSFYQVARSLVLPITVVFAIFNAQAPSRNAILCCGVVTLGFFIGCSGIGFGGRGGEQGVTLAGVCFGLGGSVVTAYHSILIKKSLSLVDDSAIVLAYYSNVGSAILLLPVILVLGEANDISKLVRGSGSLWVLTYGTLITGVVGFLMCIAGLLSVKVTSPVTHMVSSAMRGVLQTFIGIWVFNEALTQRRALSIAAILAGSCAYVWVKHAEAQAADLTNQKPTSEKQVSEKV